MARLAASLIVLVSMSIAPAAADEIRLRKEAVTPAEKKAAVAEAKATFVAFVSMSREVRFASVSAEEREVLKQLLEAVEGHFMTTCRACASAETCEADRTKIADGKGSETYNPCD